MVSTTAYCIGTVVVTSLCSVLAQSVYPVEELDYALEKRNNYQRRSFLKSFCARRCNIGKGGNVCRCNGFHFAGKRSVDMGPMGDGAPSEYMYKALTDSGEHGISPGRTDFGSEDRMKTDMADRPLPNYETYMIASHLKPSYKYSSDDVMERLMKKFVSRLLGRD